MIEERALELWAYELGEHMGAKDTSDIKRVLEYAFAFGTIIPEEHLIRAFRECFCNPPSDSALRHVLVCMKMVPALH